MYLYNSMPVTVAERSKTRTVFARSDAVIVGSNPARGMDIYMFVRFSVFVLFCVVEALQWADHPSKESYQLP
jgi:hypothetical protein